MIYSISMLIVNININVKTSQGDSLMNVVENVYRNCEFGILLFALTGTSILPLSEEDEPQPAKKTVTLPLANKPPLPSTPMTGNYHWVSRPVHPLPALLSHNTRSAWVAIICLSNFFYISIKKRGRRSLSDNK